MRGPWSSIGRLPVSRSWVVVNATLLICWGHLLMSAIMLELCDRCVWWNSWVQNMFTLTATLVLQPVSWYVKLTTSFSHRWPYMVRMQLEVRCHFVVSVEVWTPADCRMRRCWLRTCLLQVIMLVSESFPLFCSSFYCVPFLSVRHKTPWVDLFVTWYSLALLLSRSSEQSC